MSLCNDTKSLSYCNVAFKKAVWKYFMNKDAYCRYCFSLSPMFTKFSSYWGRAVAGNIARREGLLSQWKYVVAGRTFHNGHLLIIMQWYLFFSICTGKYCPKSKSTNRACVVGVMTECNNPGTDWENNYHVYCADFLKLTKGKLKCLNSNEMRIGKSWR